MLENLSGHYSVLLTSKIFFSFSFQNNVQDCALFCLHLGWCDPNCLLVIRGMQRSGVGTGGGAGGHLNQPTLPELNRCFNQPIDQG